MFFLFFFHREVEPDLWKITRKSFAVSRNIEMNDVTSGSSCRYDKLKEDFKFNLGLIEDRDLELGRYEAALQGMKDCLRDKVRYCGGGLLERLTVVPCRAASETRWDIVLC